MKKIFALLLVMVVFAACHHHHTHYRYSDNDVTIEGNAVADLLPLAKLGGFKKVEYKMINEDLSGKPFKIKLFLYDKSEEYCKYPDDELARKCAVKFIEQVEGADNYKLIEVNLVGDSPNETFVYHTSTL